MAAVLPLDPVAGSTPNGLGTRNDKAAPRQGFAFGKYRELIVAVGFFLLFDWVF